MFSFPTPFKPEVKPIGSLGAGAVLLEARWFLISDVGGFSELDSEWAPGPSLSYPPPHPGNRFHGMSLFAEMQG